MTVALGPTATEVALEQLSQRMSAKRKADRVRLHRAATKQWIRMPSSVVESRERLVEVLLDPPPHVAAMAVYDLLLCSRSIGPQRARKVLRRTLISERREVGSLTVRQAAELGGLLRDDATYATPAPAGAVRSRTPASGDDHGR